MSFYESIGATAASLISKFGQSITLRRITGGSINPITGASDEVATDYTMTGLFKTIDDDLIDNTIIKASDKMIVFSNTSETPLIDDKIVLGSDVYSIEDIKTSSPASTDLVYFVRIRK